MTHSPRGRPRGGPKNVIHAPIHAGCDGLRRTVTDSDGKPDSPDFLMISKNVARPGGLDPPILGFKGCGSGRSSDTQARRRAILGLQTQGRARRRPSALSSGSD